MYRGSKGVVLTTQCCGSGSRYTDGIVTTLIHFPSLQGETRDHYDCRRESYTKSL